MNQATKSEVICMYVPTHMCIHTSTNRERGKMRSVYTLSLSIYIYIDRGLDIDIDVEI